jgi:urease accessory protein
MLLSTEIIGDAGDTRYAGRRIELLVVTAADATRPRLRLSTTAGTDVAIQLERGSFLRHGAVVHDDGERIVVIERALERTMLIEVDPALERHEIIRQVALLAHAFGNQHVPIEVEDHRILVPITTSEGVARATVERLSLSGVRLRFEDTQLGRFEPLRGGLSHHHHAL